MGHTQYTLITANSKLVAEKDTKQTNKTHTKPLRNHLAQLFAIGEQLEDEYLLYCSDVLFIIFETSFATGSLN